LGTRREGRKIQRTVEIGEKVTLLETWRARFCIEAPELLEHFQWKTDEQAAEMLRDPEELAEISNELADVIIYCLGFSDMLTLDVSNAVQRKLERNADKYPSTGKDLQ